MPIYSLALFCAAMMYFSLYAAEPTNLLTHKTPETHESTLKKPAERPVSVPQTTEKPHHSLIRRGLHKIALGFDRFLRALGLSEPVEPTKSSDKPSQ